MRYAHAQVRLPAAVRPWVLLAHRGDRVRLVSPIPLLPRLNDLVPSIVHASIVHAHICLSARVVCAPTTC